MLLSIKNFVNNFNQTFISLFRILVFTKRVKKLDKTLYSNLHDIVILANGPSLNKMVSESSSFLDKKDLMCVNSFPSSDYFVKLKPLYLIISAPDYWLEHVRPELEVMRDELYNKLLEVNWNLIFYIPSQAKHFHLWQKLTTQNSFIKTIYYNLTPIYGFKWFRNICYSKNIGMPRPHNILIPSLMMSINLKYKNIYLWGADHSWLQTIFVDDDNKAYLTHNHFYNKEIAQPLTMQKNVNEDRKLHEMLYKFVYTFEGYFFIHEYSEKTGSNIFNCTPGSYIDAFKRLRV